MDERTLGRLADISQAIDNIHLLLEGKTAQDFQSDRFVRAAFERFIEIVSEASRHIPRSLKDTRSEIPWRQIADIGNHLRHAYWAVNEIVLWDIYDKGQLAILRGAVNDLIKGFEPDSS